jgi:U2 small nuclear ribonucleoprotein A'
MKLTPELLAQASSTINPVKERQLDLRGKLADISRYDH